MMAQKLAASELRESESAHRASETVTELRRELRTKDEVAILVRMHNAAALHFQSDAHHHIAMHLSIVGYGPSLRAHSVQIALTLMRHAEVIRAPLVATWREDALQRKEEAFLCCCRWRLRGTLPAQGVMTRPLSQDFLIA